jgi:hypothetical protein
MEGEGILPDFDFVIGVIFQIEKGEDIGLNSKKNGFPVQNDVIRLFGKINGRVLQLKRSRDRSEVQ